MRLMNFAVLLAVPAFMVMSSLGYATGQERKSCVDPASIVGASYTITNNAMSGNVKKVTVLRQSTGRMVYVLETDKLTRIYEHYGDNRIGVTEYFDVEGLGIEYEPAKNEALGWDAVYEFFPISSTKNLPITEVSEWHCLETETREGSVPEGTLKATFIRAARLPLAVWESSDRSSVTWELTAIHTDDRLLLKTLERIEGYRSYDFADLGDSENEDFFRNSEWLKYKLHGPEVAGRHH